MSRRNDRMHGQFRVESLGNIVVSASAGPWNREAVLGYRARFEQIYRELEGRSWALFGIVTVQALMTPDAELEHIALTRERAANGMSHIALLLGELEGAAVTITQFSRMYDTAGIPHRISTDAGELVSWLTSVGYAIEYDRIRPFLPTTSGSS